MEMYRLVVLLVIGIYLFSPALIEWSVHLSTYWYQPWILWLFLIIAAYYLQAKSDDHDL